MRGYYQTTLCQAALSAMLTGSLCMTATDVHAQTFQARQPTQEDHHADGAPVPALATESDPLTYAPPELPTEYDLGGLLRRTIAVSCFLAAACLGCFIWAHFRQGHQFARTTRPRQMELVESIVVAPRCFLHLVLVDGQRFLVARDPNGFHGITPVTSFAGSLLQAERHPNDGDVDMERSA